MSLFDMTDQVALVTGSSRGIGRAIALEMAALGAKVVITSRGQEACAEVVAEIEARHGAGTALSVTANLGAKEELRRVVDKAMDRFGKITSLICNAAISPYTGRTRDMEDDLFRKIIDYNVLSTQWLVNMVTPQMIERKDGAIVIISSVAGLTAAPYQSAYSISKAGDIQLTKNLAMEFGSKNIRVNCIAPGPIDTYMTKAMTSNPKVVEHMRNATLLKRWGEPVDIAGAAIFFASRAGSFTTGQTLVCDGGMLSRGMG